MQQIYYERKKKTLELIWYFHTHLYDQQTTWKHSRWHTCPGCSDKNKAREHDPLEFTMATHIKSLFSKKLIL